MDPTMAALIAFTGAASLLTITPGIDTALVLRTAASQGPNAGVAAAVGICLGCLVWAALVAVGLGALLAASRLAYTGLRWAGGAYLIWLGIGLLRRPRSAFNLGGGPSPGRGSAFARGALTNLLNPKVGVFYVSFLPQFAPPGVALPGFILLLGAIHAGLGLIWFAALIAATRPLARLLAKPAVLRGLDRATGGVFLLFGLGLALDARRP